MAEMACRFCSFRIKTTNYCRKQKMDASGADAQSSLDRDRIGVPVRFGFIKRAKTVRFLGQPVMDSQNTSIRC